MKPIDKNALEELAKKYARQRPEIISTYEEGGRTVAINSAS